MKVIRNIFNEEFEKQEKNIGNLISANFKITMEEIKRSQDKIKKTGKRNMWFEKDSRIHRKRVRREKIKKLWLKNDVKT